MATVILVLLIVTTRLTDLRFFKYLTGETRIAAAYLLDLLDMFSGCDCWRVVNALGKSAWRKKDNVEYASKNKPYTSGHSRTQSGTYH